jgi:predicted transcriptional regulator
MIDLRAAPRNSPNVPVRISPELLDRIDRAAEALQLTRSALIRLALADWVEDRDRA